MKFPLAIKILLKTILLFFLLERHSSFLEAPAPWQCGFQTPATPIMEGIINFHNHIMFFMVGVGIFVMWLLGRCLILYKSSTNLKKVDNFTHATTVEVVWTIVPAIILMIIAIPSFALLYSMDEMLDPSITLKVIAHQWYWNYEYSDYNHLKEDNSGLNFDSYMLVDSPGFFSFIGGR